MKCKKSENTIAKILGHVVDLNKIKNPTLKQILNERHIKGFLFGYEDKHTDIGRKYSEAHRERYSDKTYYDYNEHRDRHTDENYDDYISPQPGGRGSSGYDSDEYGNRRTRHIDKGYSEHTEQNFSR